jgi:glycosyltransferase involved in cell wall biosynthesis
MEGLGRSIMQRLKLAIVSTHPIQYYAPVFRTLAAYGALDLRVFFTWSQAADSVLFDHGFGAEVKWDIPLLDGYAHQFVRNVADHAGTHHFRGIRNPTLIGEIEAWQPDAILVYGWNCHSHLQALRHFKGRIPVLFRGDSTLLDDSSWWRTSLRRGFLRWIYSHVDIAVAVGSNNRDYFAWCGIPPQNIALAPHSIDTVRFAANAAKQENLAHDWRSQLGIDAEAIVFLFAGKLQRKKNPGLLLEAFGSLKAGPHLIFAGNGEIESELKAHAAKYANVHFLPFQNQSFMPVVYRLGNVFVLPSQGPGETWGLALNEAMATGRAIIASSKVGGARDLIQPGTNGWVFESGDRDALERALSRAADCGHAGLAAMGNAAQALSERWSTEESARAIRDAVLTCGSRDGREVW